MLLDPHIIMMPYFNKILILLGTREKIWVLGKVDNALEDNITCCAGKYGEVPAIVGRYVIFDMALIRSS
jgi:hypothetical protein